MAAIVLRGLAKRYGATRVIDDLNLTVNSENCNTARAERLRKIDNVESDRRADRT